MRWQLAVAILTSLGTRHGAASDSAILQLQVVEGEGAVQTAGFKSGRPVTIQVSDETGKPVAGAAVSFRLPDTDATGLFKSGMKTDVVVTGPDGKASVWGIHWGRFPGQVRIRVTAAKDQARAATVVNQYVSEPAAAKGAKRLTPSARPPGSRWKWVAIAGAGAGAGAAALAFGGKAAAPSTPAAAGVRVQVGPPTVTVRLP